MSRRGRLPCKRGRILVVTLLSIAAAACGSSSDAPAPSDTVSGNGGQQTVGSATGGSTSSTAGIAGDDGTAGTAGDDFGNAGASDPPMLQPQPTDPGPAVEVCRQLESRTEVVPVLQADVVFVLDNTGSMGSVIDQVRAHLNTFTAALADSDLDPRVVMVSAPDPAEGGWFGICIPPPLGSGQCPDDGNPPSYVHVSEHILDTEPPVTTEIFVQDTSLLDHLMWAFSQYRTVLRPGTRTNFVAITDHDSVTTADYFSRWADAQWELNDPGWRFHGMFCLDGGCAEPDKWSGFRVGTIYQELVDATGGVAVQIVDENLDAVLQGLAADIVDHSEPVPCTWGLPEAPEGEALDPLQVNVHFTGPDGVEQDIYAVRDKADCAITEGGWYYDDPDAPARIHVCPLTCEVMRVQPQATIELELGCARRLDPRVD